MFLFLSLVQGFSFHHYLPSLDKLKYIRSTSGLVGYGTPSISAPRLAPLFLLSHSMHVIQAATIQTRTAPPRARKGIILTDVSGASPTSLGVFSFVLVDPFFSSSQYLR